MNSVLARFTENPLMLQAGITMYIVWAVCLFIIAQQEKEEFAWFAFVPFLNLLLMAKLAKMNPLWWLLTLTCVGLLIVPVFWYKIGERKGSLPAIMGALVLLPCFWWLSPIIIAASSKRS
ncbi:MAG: hypothetical protein KF824_13590 [Fimbriimonadaceae bacterium]|nr:MAG: hypothetical protein KF824_13590 [Fimbriimonadaceae bacterium]